jgi:hypothetical protein
MSVYLMHDSLCFDCQPAIHLLSHNIGKCQMSYSVFILVTDKINVLRNPFSHFQCLEATNI